MKDTETKKELDIKTIIKNNPLIDAEKFKKTQQLLDEFKKTGPERKEYSLSSPFERRTNLPAD